MREVVRQSTLIDLAAFDADERPVLLAEVKAMSGAFATALSWVQNLASNFQRTGLSVPYWMVVDLDQIQIFQTEDGSGFVMEFQAATGDVLSAYDPAFRQKRIFEDYLLTLVNAWLHDLADQWKSDNPPGLEPLTEAGLVTRLRGGETHREVSFAKRDFVYRDQLLDESLFGP